jgi:hypothetical protein
MERLGVDPADSADVSALTASLDATIALVLRSRRDLADANGMPVPDIGDDEWQGVVILACLDYRASNSPNGFTGFDGGLAPDSAERFRAQQLLRMNRWVVPRVG